MAVKDISTVTLMMISPILVELWVMNIRAGLCSLCKLTLLSPFTQYCNIKANKIKFAECSSVSSINRRLLPVESLIEVLFFHNTTDFSRLSLNKKNTPRYTGNFSPCSLKGWLVCFPNLRLRVRLMPDDLGVLCFQGRLRFCGFMTALNCVLVGWS